MSSDVCIIILNHNGADLLKSALNQIGQNTLYPADSYDTVVVDNASTDHSVSVVESFDAELIRNDENIGVAAGYNRGIHQNPGYDFYLVMNNDIFPNEGWLEPLVDAAETNAQAGLFGPKLLYPNGSRIQSAGYRLPKVDNYREGLSTDDVRSRQLEDGLIGAALLIKRELIDSIGYFDEIFSQIYYEELDYCLRARAAGYDAMLVADSTVIHQKEESEEDLKAASEFHYFMDRKNHAKFQLVNAGFSNTIDSIYKEVYGAIFGLKHHGLKTVLRAYQEVVNDLRPLIKRRYHRTAYLPPYYSTGQRNYPGRYL